MSVISFWRIFWLEGLAFIRSRTLVVLTAVCLLWIFAFPFLVRGDGTQAGLRELTIRYSLGGVFVLLAISLLALSAGAIARERAARRLQLTLVRPVLRVTVVLGRMAAHVTVGALLLGLSCLCLLVRLTETPACNHVLRPVLPSPAVEAQRAYEHYLKSPETPEAVKKAKKKTVLNLLARRALDRYQVLPTNAVVSWRFDLSSFGPLATAPAVFLRFASQQEMRQPIVGVFRLGEASGSLTNVTQASLEIPLTGGASNFGDTPELTFENRGNSAVMLRPRKDIGLLVPADSFQWNLMRVFLALVAILSVLVAFGTFLSATLSRPVALFVAFAVLIVGEMSPSVLEQYPDGLETDAIDRLGLGLTRLMAEIAQPISAQSPLEALASNTCLEGRELGKTLFCDLIVLPAFLALLSAFALGRKQEE